MADEEEDNSGFLYPPPAIGHNQGPPLPEEDPKNLDKMLTITKLLGSDIQPMSLSPEEQKGQQVSRPKKLLRGIGSLAKSPWVKLVSMAWNQVPAEKREQAIDYLNSTKTNEMFSQGLAYFKDLFSSYNTGGISSLTPEDVKRIQEEGWEHHMRRGIPVGEPTGLSGERVESLIKPILEKLPEKIRKRISVVDQPLQEWRGKASDSALAFYQNTASGNPDNRRVTLIANRLKSPEMVEVALLHELYGHMGLSELLTTLGQEENPLKHDKLEDNLLRIYEGIGGIEGIKKYAPEGFNIDEYLDIYKDQERTPEGIKKGLTEEVFSWIAQDNNPSINRYVNEITGSVRNWMREKGFTNLSNVRKPDLLHILKQTRRKLQRGGSLANKQPSLTLSKTPDLKSPGSNWPDIVPSSTRNVPFFKKAEGGFIDGPLYDNARMIG